MMNKIYFIGKAGNIVEGIINAYNNNEIEAICVGILKKDGTMHTGWDTDSKFIHRIGLASTLLQDIYKNVTNT